MRLVNDIEISGVEGNDDSANANGEPGANRASEISVNEIELDEPSSSVTVVTVFGVGVEGDENKAKELGIQVKYVFVRPEKMHLDEITQLLETGKMVPPFIEDYPLEKAAAALEKQKSGHVRGKLVLKTNVS